MTNSYLQAQTKVKREKLKQKQQILHVKQVIKYS